jgi:hypothetical protein
VIAEAQAGAIDYSRMGLAVAAGIRARSGAIRGIFDKLGPLKSVTFQGRGGRGADIFLAEFAKGRTEWRIMLGDGGRIAALTFQPLP